ncbi:hypothetical protein VP393E501_P0058 [Vibrio phage 393E50-1]|nr:hypothetical protein VP393E501_P0058 [Vibrio phage 393E50-1]
MLVLKGLTYMSAIDWVGIESITFDENVEVGNSKMDITTKSGCRVTTLNPSDLKGEPLGFEEMVDAWFEDRQKFVVVENDIRVTK